LPHHIRCTIDKKYMKKRATIKTKKNGRKDHMEVLLESIKSDFQAFDEKLEGLGKKMIERFNEIDDSFGLLEEKFDELERRVARLEHESARQLMNEETIKVRLSTIQDMLREDKKTKEKFQIIESRLLQLETAFKKAN